MRTGTKNGGFTIMEIVISVGLLALVIPLVIALTAASGQASRSASDDTKAAFVARSVLQEIAEARSGSGQLIEGELDWPEFPVEGDRYVFAVDIDGVLVGQLSTREYESGSRDSKVAYLVSARGEEQEVCGAPGSGYPFPGGNPRGIPGRRRSGKPPQERVCPIDAPP